MKEIVVKKPKHTDFSNERLIYILKLNGFGLEKKYITVA